MAWPKRGTRRIVVDGEAFLWHYDACCPWCSDQVMTAGKEGERHFLFIDPYPHVFEMGPKVVAEAIGWAKSRRWSAESGPTRAIAMDRAVDGAVDSAVDRAVDGAVDGAATFQWLPEGQRHLVCVAPQG